MWKKVFLPDGELNPGLPRDRRGSLPLDYQGCMRKVCLLHLIKVEMTAVGVIGSAKYVETSDPLFFTSTTNVLVSKISRLLD